MQESIINDICYEIQDIIPFAKDCLYEFIECPSELKMGKLKSIVSGVSDDTTVKERVLDILFWYGVLGFKKATGECTYIYSVGYDIKRLRAMISKRSDDSTTFVINPAFWKGLDIKLA